MLALHGRRYSIRALQLPVAARTGGRLRQDWPSPFLLTIDPPVYLRRERGARDNLVMDDLGCINIISWARLASERWGRGRRIASPMIYSPFCSFFSFFFHFFSITVFPLPSFLSFSLFHNLFEYIVRSQTSSPNHCTSSCPVYAGTRVRRYTVCSFH